MDIRPATKEDLHTIARYDRHITKEELANSIGLNRVLLAEENGQFVGWLRYNLFWDNTPFMNMLFVLEMYRGRGVGRRLVAHWEERMWQMGYTLVMTSTVAEEYAQHFYHKLGYRAIGGFLPEGDPYEVILSKRLL